MPTHDEKVFQPRDELVKEAHISGMDQYLEKYKESIESPREFWAEIAKQFHWETPAQPDKFLQYNFDISKGPISIKWMEGATTNICYNLLDRNIKRGHGESVAFYWYVSSSEGCCFYVYRSKTEEWLGLNGK